ncbi:MAG: hypothetical protein CVT71_03060 [Alphaproteobacteria bacterium HGW-Alphaproteobacteria-10]|nr:MAG: hypothetical protein CVT71_03060 [Alphaproteobacteria bacterium HGW-Alphaproteobacteria-10]
MTRTTQVKKHLQTADRSRQWAELARLMVRHGVGVTVTKTLQLARLDSDYFDPDVVHRGSASRVVPGPWSPSDQRAAAVAILKASAAISRASMPMDTCGTTGAPTIS